MKITKEILEKLILIEKKSYKEIGRIFGFSDTYIKKTAKSLGIPLPIRSKFPDGFVPHNKNKKYSNNLENICIVCENPTRNKKFCSNKCQGYKTSYDNYIYYLNNQSEFCGFNYNPKSFKSFILKEQDYKCSICNSLNIWNKKKLIFVLDHIDGNAYNNLRKNLRLVCPNCDSQLSTFKSKNKNSARKTRYLKNYK